MKKIILILFFSVGSLSFSDDQLCFIDMWMEEMKKDLDMGQLASRKRLEMMKLNNLVRQEKKSIECYKLEKSHGLIFGDRIFEMENYLVDNNLDKTIKDKEHESNKENVVTEEDQSRKPKENVENKKPKEDDDFKMNKRNDPKMKKNANIEINKHKEQTNEKKDKEIVAPKLSNEEHYVNKSESKITTGSHYNTIGVESAEIEESNNEKSPDHKLINKDNEIEENTDEIMNHNKRSDDSVIKFQISDSDSDENENNNAILNQTNKDESRGNEADETVNTDESSDETQNQLKNNDSNLLQDDNDISDMSNHENDDNLENNSSTTPLQTGINDNKDEDTNDNIGTEKSTSDNADNAVVNVETNQNDGPTSDNKFNIQNEINVNNDKEEINVIPESQFETDDMFESKQNKVGRETKLEHGNTAERNREIEERDKNETDNKDEIRDDDQTRHGNVGHSTPVTEKENEKVSVEKVIGEDEENKEVTDEDVERNDMVDNSTSARTEVDDKQNEKAENVNMIETKEQNEEIVQKDDFQINENKEKKEINELIEDETGENNKRDVKTESESGVNKKHNEIIGNVKKNKKDKENEIKRDINIDHETKKIISTKANSKPVVKNEKKNKSAHSTFDENKRMKLKERIKKKVKKVNISENGNTMERSSEIEERNKSETEIKAEIHVENQTISANVKHSAPESEKVENSKIYVLNVIGGNEKKENVSDENVERDRIVDNEKSVRKKEPIDKRNKKVVSINKSEIKEQNDETVQKENDQINENVVNNEIKGKDEMKELTENETNDNNRQDLKTKSGSVVNKKQIDTPSTVIKNKQDKANRMQKGINIGKISKKITSTKTISEHARTEKTITNKNENKGAHSTIDENKRMKSKEKVKKKVTISEHGNTTDRNREIEERDKNETDNKDEIRDDDQTRHGNVGHSTPVTEKENEKVSVENVISENEENKEVTDENVERNDMVDNSTSARKEVDDKQNQHAELEIDKDVYKMKIENQNEDTVPKEVVQINEKVVNNENKGKEDCKELAKEEINNNNELDVKTESDLGVNKKLSEIIGKVKKEIKKDINIDDESKKIISIKANSKQNLKDEKKNKNAYSTIEENKNRKKSQEKIKKNIKRSNISETTNNMKSRQVTNEPVTDKNKNIKSPTIKTEKNRNNNEDLSRKLSKNDSLVDVTKLPEKEFDGINKEHSLSKIDTKKETDTNIFKIEMKGKEDHTVRSNEQTRSKNNNKKETQNKHKTNIEHTDDNKDSNSQQDHKDSKTTKNIKHDKKQIEKQEINNNEKSLSSDKNKDVGNDPKSEHLKNSKSEKLAEKTRGDNKTNKHGAFKENETHEETPTDSNVIDGADIEPKREMETEGNLVNKIQKIKHDKKTDTKNKYNNNLPSKLQTENLETEIKKQDNILENKNEELTEEKLNVTENKDRIKSQERDLLENLNATHGDRSKFNASESQHVDITDKEIKSKSNLDNESKKTKVDNKSIDIETEISRFNQLNDVIAAHNVKLDHLDLRIKKYEELINFRIKNQSLQFQKRFLQIEKDIHKLDRKIEQIKSVCIDRFNKHANSTTSKSEMEKTSKAVNEIRKRFMEFENETRNSANISNHEISELIKNTSEIATGKAVQYVDNYLKGYLSKWKYTFSQSHGPTDTDQNCEYWQKIGYKICCKNDQPWFKSHITKEHMVDEERTENEITSCSDVGESERTISIFPMGNKKLKTEVVCRNRSVVILQRRSDHVNFTRSWNDYKFGFGELTDSFWIGLEILYYLTELTPYRLIVSIKDWENNTFRADYDRFQVSSEREGYQLIVGGYRGDSGDSLTSHNGTRFSTVDVDNDNVHVKFGGSCSNRFRGGWWYYSCYKCNPTGIYYNQGKVAEDQFDGISWKTLRPPNYSFQQIEMSIQPIHNVHTDL